MKFFNGTNHDPNEEKYFKEWNMFDESNVEAILGSLIEVDISNPLDGNYGRIHKIIKRVLSSTGCKVKLVKTSPERVKELVKKETERALLLRRPI